MKIENSLKKICSSCGKAFTGAPALSRTDNATLLCPDCGTREALESIGIAPNEQDAILEIIHKHIERE